MVVGPSVGPRPTSPVQQSPLGHQKNDVHGADPSCSGTGESHLVPGLVSVADVA